MVIQAHLGSLTLEMPQIESIGSANTLYLIDNKMQKGDHLIDVTYKQVYKYTVLISHNISLLF